jgi:hypothetical protein
MPKLWMMKALPMWTILWIGLSLQLPAVASGSPALQASHDLAVQLDPVRAQLAGIDRITLNNLSASAIRLLIGENVVIDHLRINGNEAEYRRQGARMVVDLPASGDLGRLHLEIRYSGRFNDPAPSDPINTDNPGFGVSGTISPRGTLLLGGAGWYPSVEDAAERFRLEVAAPPGIRSVTAGRPLAATHRGDLTVSAWQIDTPVERLALVAGSFKVREKRSGHLYAATYFLEDDPVLSDQYLQASLQYLAEYEALFGPYPFAKFAVVENFFPTGYGFPSFTLIGGRVLRLPFIIHTSLKHEIAHCWWGNGVRVDYDSGNWSEGLTTYVSDYRYRERTSAAAAREYRRQLLRNYTELVPPQQDFALTQFLSRHDPLTRAVGYDKAAMVFHMLRQQVGDPVFWKTLRQLATERMFQTTSWQDIQTAFEAGCGCSLETFFRQWVRRAGAPQLILTQIERRSIGSGARVHGILRQSGTAFELAVPIRLTAGASTYEQDISVRGAQTDFEIQVPFMPARLEADPRSDIMRRLAPREIPPTINRLKSTRDLLVVLPDGRDGDRAGRIADRLGRALGLDNMQTVAAAEWSSKGGQAQNIMLMMTEENADTAAIWKHWLEVTPNSFSFQGKTFDRRRHTLVAVLPHPIRLDGFAAVYLFGQDEDRMRIATKVPHYGKYSYLVFERARNVVKATWPVNDSPLVYIWGDEPAG